MLALIVQNHASCHTEAKPSVENSHTKCERKCKAPGAHNVVDKQGDAGGGVICTRFRPRQLARHERVGLLLGVTHGCRAEVRQARQLKEWSVKT